MTAVVGGQLFKADRGEVRSVQHRWNNAVTRAGCVRRGSVMDAAVLLDLVVIEGKRDRRKGKPITWHCRRGHARRGGAAAHKQLRVAVVVDVVRLHHLVVDRALRHNDVVGAALGKLGVCDIEGGAGNDVAEGHVPCRTADERTGADADPDGERVVDVVRERHGRLVLPLDEVEDVLDVVGARRQQPRAHHVRVAVRHRADDAVALVDADVEGRQQQVHDVEHVVDEVPRAPRREVVQVRDADRRIGAAVHHVSGGQIFAHQFGGQSASEDFADAGAGFCDVSVCDVQPDDVCEMGAFGTLPCRGRGSEGGGEADQQDAEHGMVDRRQVTRKRRGDGARDDEGRIARDDNQEPRREHHARSAEEDAESFEVVVARRVVGRVRVAPAAPRRWQSPEHRDADDGDSGGHNPLPSGRNDALVDDSGGCLGNRDQQYCDQRDGGGAGVRTPEQKLFIRRGRRPNDEERRRPCDRNLTNSASTTASR
jgi:hypothetical protein